MLCTYCLVRKPWDREHFPNGVYAKCWDCVRRESSAASPSETDHWEDA